MYTLLNLDVVGRALDLPQGRVPCPPLGLEGGGGRVYGGSRRRGGSGNLDWYFFEVIK